MSRSRYHSTTGCTLGQGGRETNSRLALQKERAITSVVLSGEGRGQHNADCAPECPRGEPSRRVSCASLPGPDRFASHGVAL